MPLHRTATIALIGLGLLIVGCGANPTDVLISQLQDDDAKVRRSAAQSLAKVNLADERVASALLRASDDADPHVRRIAINALARSPSPPSDLLGRLTDALQDPERSVRINAALAIQSLDPTSDAFIPVLDHALQTGDGVVFLEVGKMSDDAAWALPTLKRLLSHRDTKIRHLSARTLAKLGSAAVDAKSALTRALRDPEEPVRKAAQQALDQLHTNESAPQ